MCFLMFFSLQRMCEQLHLYTTGKPEEVRVTSIKDKEDVLCMYTCHNNRYNMCVCRSSTGRPDWTCVVVGFSSGYVRFYTEVPLQSKVSCYHMF